MQPLPETTAALSALALATDVGDLQLVDQVDRAVVSARRIAPGCVGVTMTVVQDAVSVTWVTTDLDAATLDAVQYLEGGPCVDAVRECARVADADTRPPDERRWHTFAAASARAGVSSTLSMPLVADGRVYGGVNLYGNTARTFDGRHDELAALFGGVAGGAVPDADLSFMTLARARTAPRVLEDGTRTNLVVGMIMAAHEVPETTARHTLTDAAARAGVPEGRLAGLLLQTGLA